MSLFQQRSITQLHGYTIEGPFRLVDSDIDKKYKQIAKQIAGTEMELSNEAYARNMLERFRLVRSDALLTTQRLKISSIATGGVRAIHSAGNAPVDAKHPITFIYRSLRPGKLDDHDRYDFCHQGPPDRQLNDLAHAGKLTETEELQRQAMRLMPASRDHPLVQTSQASGLIREVSDPSFQTEFSLGNAKSVSPKQKLSCSSPT